MKARIVAVLVAILVTVAALGAYLYLSSPSPTNISVAPGNTTCPTTSPGAASPGKRAEVYGNWTTYHADNSRSGNEASAVTGTPRLGWAAPTTLDGQVYAEPLVCGNTVIVATESDSVYAINASSGAVDWKTTLGTPVAGASLPCGDIDPSGITGTPVVDTATQTLYVVAFLSSLQHVLFAVNLGNGSVQSQTVVDPLGADPTIEQQRGALALSNGVVYIPYGGLDGDCGAYHGWIVGVRTDGSGGLLSYQVPTGRAGGIWAPAGITVLPNGDLLVATGNSDATVTFDYGDSVLELSSSLQLIDYFAPTNWAQLNSGDTDLGSVAPTILPSGDVFQIGKEGVGFLLSGSALGGIGGQLFSASVCSASFGGTAHSGSSVFVPCVDGLYREDVAGSSFATVWQTTAFDAGPPVVTGSVVWTVDIGGATLLGFNITNGQPLYSFPLGSVDHFVTPAAAPGWLYVGAGSQLYAFALS